VAVLVGVLLGVRVAVLVGVSEGVRVGVIDGVSEGVRVGRSVGVFVGALVGVNVGSRYGGVPEGQPVRLGAGMYAAGLLIDSSGMVGVGVGPGNRMRPSG
jgi:hypothetical protein